MQYLETAFLLLTLKKYLSVGCERQVIMFWKHKKRYICFIIKVARPISFSNLSGNDNRVYDLGLTICK